jgi:hypothetical protein
VFLCKSGAVLLTVKKTHVNFTLSGTVTTASKELFIEAFQMLVFLKGGL